jgi:hypothetical protein
MTTTLIHPSIATARYSSRRSPVAWLATLLRPLTARPGKHTPAATTPFNAAHDAAAVRALAYRHLQTEPSFAADLFAAADRHQTMLDRDTGNHA